LLPLFGVPDGSGLIKADLQVTHEGINRWPFGHESATIAMPHQSLPRLRNGILMLFRSFPRACVNAWW
jgi:hypothetical protein